MNTKDQELSRLWSIMCKLDHEMKIEALICGKRGEITQNYKNLKRDSDKARGEYNKIQGGTEYNPMSLEHNERMTTKKVMGDMMGRSGEGTHHKLGE